MELTALKKPGPLPFFVQTAFSDAPAARLLSDITAGLGTSARHDATQV